MAAYEAGVSSSSTESSAVVLLADEASSAATVLRLVSLARPTLLTPLCSTDASLVHHTYTRQLTDNQASACNSGLYKTDIRFILFLFSINIKYFSIEFYLLNCNNLE